MPPVEELQEELTQDIDITEFVVDLKAVKDSIASFLDNHQSGQTLPTEELMKGLNFFIDLYS